MQEGFISVNGEIYEAKDAKISVLDRGFLFGDSVFEVFLAIRGKVFDLEPHLERLRESAFRVDFEIRQTNAELAFEISQVLARVKSERAYIRLCVSRGCGLGLAIPDFIETNRVIYAFAAPKLSEEKFATGFKLKLLEKFQEPCASIKSSNYLDSIVSLARAKNQGFDDVLFYNSGGEIREATTANIFFIGMDGDLLEICTPALESGILSGITRGNLIAILREAKIPVFERVIDRSELPSFDEAFLCSTVRGLVPISYIGEQRLYTTRSKALFHSIYAMYEKWIEKELELEKRKSKAHVM